MNIQYASDLHLEFPENSLYLSYRPLVVSAEILVLAGDIGYLGGESYKQHPFWDWAAENYRHVIVVPGNHEFYGGYDLANVEDGAEGEIRKNIHWYYNKTVLIDDVEFILSPLWAFIPPDAVFIISRRINDFRRIMYSGELLSVAKFNMLHKEAVEFVKNALANSNAVKKVVVTHHLPSMRCVTPRFQGDIFNGAFASEQSDWIENCGADLWIYGHSHGNIEELVIGKTRLVCNQFGYLRAKEHLCFNNSANYKL